MRQRAGEVDVQGTIDRGQPQRPVFDRLGQHPPPLGPRRQCIVIEQVPRQAVHLAKATTLVDRLGQQIVGGEVITPRHQRTVEIPLLAGHPVQRVDSAGSRHDRQQGVVGMHQQLGPGPIDRQRLDTATVGRQSPLIDQAASSQEGHSRRVGPAIERHRQIKRGGVHSDRRTGERHPFGIAGQLELRRRRAK